MGLTESDIVDVWELHELRAKYSRAIDFENYERASEIFTDDAVVEYPSGTCTGAGEVETYWRENVAYEFSMHTVQMPEITVDGDTATGTWYMLVLYSAPDGSEGYVMGWYEDEYRRVDDGWKIAAMDMAVIYDTDGYHT